MKCTVFPYKLLLLPSFLLYNKDWGIILTFLQWTNLPAPSASTSRFVKWEHSTRWGSRESRSGPGVCNVLQPQASVSNLSHRPTTPRHPRTPTRLQSLRATAPVRGPSQDARGRCGVQSACVGGPRKPCGCRVGNGCPLLKPMVCRVGDWSPPSLSRSAGACGWRRYPQKEIR